MKIATWNVNSLNVRLAHVLEWLGSASPDVLVLQEIKQRTEAFDEPAFREAGYHAVASGQKTSMASPSSAATNRRIRLRTSPDSKTRNVASWPQPLTASGL